MTRTIRIALIALTVVVTGMFASSVQAAMTLAFEGSGPSGMGFALPFIVMAGLVVSMLVRGGSRAA